MKHSKFTAVRLDSIIAPQCGSGVGESIGRAVVAGAITAACGPFAIICGSATLIAMGAYCAS